MMKRRQHQRPEKALSLLSLSLLLNRPSSHALPSNFPSVPGETELFTTYKRHSNKHPGRAKIETVQDAPDPLIDLESDLESEFDASLGVNDLYVFDLSSFKREKSSPVPQKSSSRPAKVHAALARDYSEANLEPLMNNEKQIPANRLRSTGTTIVGCLAERGKYVVLGADTRATDDRMVADKRCEKIHRIATNVWCCGAGTSADLEALTRRAQYTMALYAMQKAAIGNSNLDLSNLDKTGGILLRTVRVSAVCRFLRSSLYEAKGSLGCNFIVGGYDPVEECGKIVAIHPHGSVDALPYSALGSGGLAAMAVLEARYRPHMSIEEGITLVKDAVTAGIDNDLGSGSQVDLCVLGPNGRVDYTRAFSPEEQLEDIDGVYDDTANVLETGLGDAKGVNGFGNQKYRVESKRIVASTDADLARAKEWDTILGFSPSRSERISDE
jgi:20S proteasome subunit beta 2